jgi:calcineurin-like phosphoesterase family protein
MSKVRFIGCLHLGHKWMAKHRGFYDSFHHDDYLVHSWNQVVDKRDIVYVVGDVTMEKRDDYETLSLLNGTKYLVMGNHDMGQHNDTQLKYFKKIMGSVDYKGFMITHVPIHPNEVVWYRGNIHAHIHHNNKLEEVIVSDKYTDEGYVNVPTKHLYYNVDAHLIGYKPKTIDELKLMYGKQE